MPTSTRQLTFGDQKAMKCDKIASCRYARIDHRKYMLGHQSLGDQQFEKNKIFRVLFCS